MPRSAPWAPRGSRIAVVNPPWFDDMLSAFGADHFRKSGFDVVHHGPCGLPSRQKEITPHNLSEWIRATAARHDPEAVLVAGNGIRATGTIRPLEEELGFNVVTANQAILWHCLHPAGAAASSTE